MLLGHVPHHQVGQPRARRVTFEPVKDQDKNPGRLADHTENVGGSDVAAADGANIDPARLRDEKSRRNGSDKIRQHNQRDIAHNVHIVTVETKTPNLKVQTAA